MASTARATTIRATTILAALTAALVLVGGSPALADPTPTTSAPAPSTAPAPSGSAMTSAPSGGGSSTAPAPSGSTTPSASPSATASGIPGSFIAQLASLQKQAADLQTSLTAVQVNAATAFTAYDQTTTAVQQALDGAAAAQSGLDAANAKVAAGRKQIQLVIRDAYVQSTPHTSSALLLTSNVDDLDFTVAALGYLAGRSAVTLQEFRADQAAAAAHQAEVNSALDKARQLQATADTQRATALTALGTAQSTQATFLASVAGLQSKVAATAATVTAADKPAYDAFVAALTALGAPATAGGTIFVPGGPGAPPLAGTSWTRPTLTGHISSCYCMRGSEFHHGVDIAAPMGTPIYAVGAGTVVAAGPAQGFGNWVVIDHHDGSFSIYGHERVLATTVGTPVTPGTLIGFVGSEGESTGPHLHFEVRVGSYANSSSSTDPVLWLAQRGVTLVP